MTEREKELLRMCVIYAIANLSDVIEAFENNYGLDVNGDEIAVPNEDELDCLMKTLQ